MKIVDMSIEAKSVKVSSTSTRDNVFVELNGVDTYDIVQAIGEDLLDEIGSDAAAKYFGLE